MVTAHVPILAPQALDDNEIALLQVLLDRVPQPLQPLDVSAVDGFLCGVLLQPNAVEVSCWWPSVTDVDGRSLPQGFDARDLQGLVLRRFAQLDQAIAARQWFDPWVFEMDAQTSPSETVLPWIAGFAAAMERFPDLMRIDDARLMEPLALLYLHFDPDDLEDAQALQDLIDTLEPPADLGEAVQDIVRSLMLIADITRPAAPIARPEPRPRRPHARRSR
jgi:uncharacterized protein